MKQCLYSSFIMNTVHNDQWYSVCFFVNYVSGKLAGTNLGILIISELWLKSQYIFRNFSRSVCLSFCIFLEIRDPIVQQIISLFAKYWTSAVFANLCLWTFKKYQWLHENYLRFFLKKFKDTRSIFFWYLCNLKMELSLF